MTEQKNEIDVIKAELRQLRKMWALMSMTMHIRDKGSDSVIAAFINEEARLKDRLKELTNDTEIRN